MQIILYQHSACSVSGSVRGTGDNAVNKTDKKSCSHGAYILGGETDEKYNT